MREKSTPLKSINFIYFSFLKLKNRLLYFTFIIHATYRKYGIFRNSGKLNIWNITSDITHNRILAKMRIEGKEFCFRLGIPVRNFLARDHSFGNRKQKILHAWKSIRTFFVLIFPSNQCLEIVRLLNLIYHHTKDDNTIFQTSRTLFSIHQRTNLSHYLSST